MTQFTSIWPLYFGHDAPKALILKLVGASLLNILPHVASDFAKGLEEGWPLFQAVTLSWWVFSLQYHTLSLLKRSLDPQPSTQLENSAHVP